jgi:triosephosphate isomerase
MACIGEQLADRQSGATMAVCAEQLEGMIMHYISRFFMSF